VAKWSRHGPNGAALRLPDGLCRGSARRLRSRPPRSRHGAEIPRPRADRSMPPSTEVGQRHDVRRTCISCNNAQFTADNGQSRRLALEGRSRSRWGRGCRPWGCSLSGHRNSQGHRHRAPQRRLPATAAQAPRPASSPSVVWIVCAIHIGRVPHAFGLRLTARQLLLGALPRFSRNGTCPPPGAPP